ncbi:MAG: hypothetical protein ACK47E_01995 [Cyclobacteriaceae bacterium]
MAKPKNKESKKVASKVKLSLAEAKKSAYTLIDKWQKQKYEN